MTFDRPKLAAKAMSCASKGQLERAIELYRKLIEHDPSDAHAWLKVAELCRRKGASGEAADAYVEAARRYRASGFAHKAAAAFEQVLRLRPGEAAIHADLGELYIELSQICDARRHFEAAAIAFEKADHSIGLMGALQQLLKHDPTHIKHRYRLAELFANSEQFGDAVEHYMELASQYLRINDPTRALHTLRYCYEQQPKNTNLLALMARAFEAAGRSDKVAAILAERARLLGTDGDAMLARGTARRRPTSPQDVQLAKLFDEAIAYMRRGDNDRAVPLLRAVLASQPDHEAAQLALSQLTGDLN